MRTFAADVLEETVRVCHEARGAYGPAVAERFGVCPRTARRMIAAAREAGYELPVPSSTRLPFEPLERAAGRENHLVLAAALGTTSETLYRYKHDGLSVFVADRLAIRLGLHPSAVWVDWYEVAA